MRLEWAVKESKELQILLQDKRKKENTLHRSVLLSSCRATSQCWKENWPSPSQRNTTLLRETAKTYFLQWTNVNTCSCHSSKLGKLERPCIECPLPSLNDKHSIWPCCTLSMRVLKQWGTSPSANRNQPNLDFILERTNNVKVSLVALLVWSNYLLTVCWWNKWILVHKPPV